MEQDTATVTLDGEPFNPQTVDLNHPNVTLQAFRPSGEAGTIQTHLYLAWTMDYNKARDHEDNVRPSWADLPQSERIYLTLSKSTANYVTRTPYPRGPSVVEVCECCGDGWVDIVVGHQQQR